MKKIRLIDWPYPDRQKLQQLRMTWRETRREGLNKSFRRLRPWEVGVVLAVFLVVFGLSMLLTKLLVG